MGSKDCPFCAVIKQNVPARRVKSFDVPGFVAFFDHRPQLNTHVIIASREHIETFAGAAHHRDRLLLAEGLIRAVWEVTQVLAITKYRVVINNGVGSRIGHMHAHVLSKQTPWE